jgi:methionine salvage enolase-phosphatase E1
MRNLIPFNETKGEDEMIPKKYLFLSLCAALILFLATRGGQKPSVGHVVAPYTERELLEFQRQMIADVKSQLEADRQQVAATTEPSAKQKASVGDILAPYTKRELREFQQQMAEDVKWQLEADQRRLAAMAESSTHATESEPGVAAQREEL